MENPSEGYVLQVAKCHRNHGILAQNRKKNYTVLYRVAKISSHHCYKSNFNYNSIFNATSQALTVDSNSEWAVKVLVSVVISDFIQHFRVTGNVKICTSLSLGKDGGQCSGVVGTFRQRPVHPYFRASGVDVMYVRWTETTDWSLCIWQNLKQYDH